MLSPVTAADGWLGSTDNVYYKFSSLNLSATGENNPGLINNLGTGTPLGRLEVRVRALVFWHVWTMTPLEHRDSLFLIRSVIVDPVTNLDASHGSPLRNYSRPCCRHLTLICVVLGHCQGWPVGFHQLAVLYNLSRGDTGFLFNRPYPPPMSATTPSSPHLPSIESSHPGSSFSPIRSESKTPEHKPNATHSVPHPTLIALGSSIL